MILKRKQLETPANGPIERTVSWAEYQTLLRRFNALCEHLGVRVDIPYQPIVTKFKSQIIGGGTTTNETEG